MSSAAAVTARQVVFPRAGELELDEIAVPEPAPGELLGCTSPT